ncbi:hypothetical protein A0O34_16650 [Chryseobacterium glaciei]|uniref:Uncharacterized protein n=1 Tax=Chryseobacterium glaciei TaxID=1685010 RepID=A0A172XYF9_9FLAO|nr:hypothetical protein [Chryseobacterium glaciei]ANF52043.1 hypothetical protein A0O34_16650 [Chryseobacterium glaciei]
MDEKNKLTTREELKTYFETGKYPTQSQFGQFIDNYVHLNEFNFGLDVKASGSKKKKFYHFYLAEDIEKSGRGHLNIEDKEGDLPKQMDKYVHVLSRDIAYKCLSVKLLNELDIDKYQPKIIIKRYKQQKTLKSGYVKKAGFYQELPSDAESWGRQSEYPVTSHEMVIDINPINYFRPSDDYKEFFPSGTFNRPGSFKYSKHHRKPFSLIQMFLEIDVNGTKFKSSPVNIKIILGSRDERDLINYIIN